MSFEIITRPSLSLVGTISALIMVKYFVDYAGYRISKAMRVQVYNYDKVIGNFEKRIRLDRRIKDGVIADRQEGQNFNTNPRQVTSSMPEFVDRKRYDCELKKYKVMLGICEAYPEKKADNSLFKLLEMILKKIPKINNLKR